jgi:ketopantoate hydroxymethyltransferase
MDIAPDTSEEYYVPVAPDEQLEAVEQEIALNQASMNVVEKLLADFDTFISHAKSIDGVVVGKGVATDAQILAKQAIVDWCEARKSELSSRYNAAKESLESTK